SVASCSAGAPGPVAAWPASSFLFQAEDGIRDFHVTGVQTCALPICPGGVPTISSVTDTGDNSWTTTPDASVNAGVTVAVAILRKIGRASCRERGERWVVGGSRRTRARERTRRASGEGRATR